MTKRRPKVSKAIPEFSSEDEERRFWAKADTTEYFDWARAAEPALPNLKPSTESISLRLPVSMLEEIKALANKRDVPYQSLMKIFLAERIQRERGRKAS
jgi:predicted DNA binding CopG/RHH family protein